MLSDEKAAYEAMKNMKDKFGVFHKTCFHLHTPASHDYTLREGWQSADYKTASLEDVFKICLERGVFPDIFTIESLPELQGTLSIYSNQKEFLSYILIAHELMVNEIEIVLIADHHTIVGYKKLKMAIKVLDEQKNYKVYPEVFLGVEISCADKNHVVGIIDGTNSEQVDKLSQWLKENLFNEELGTFRTSLDVVKQFDEWNGFGYIAHINTSNMFDGAFLSGAYKTMLFNDNNVRVFGLSALEAKEWTEAKIKAYGGKPTKFVLDNDSHHIDGIQQKCFYLKGSKRNYSMLIEAMGDYDISVTFSPPDMQRQYIKGLYIQNSEDGFLIGKDANAFCMNFSDALNCLIGGRGTGKSSVLEMLEYILSQRSKNENALDFLCSHGNAWVLYVYNNEEYLIEMRMPKKEYKDDRIVNYFGQNSTRKHGVRVYYDPISIKKYALSHYLKIYKVLYEKENYFLQVMSGKESYLAKFFDTSYSVNELVNAASGEKIGGFIYSTILKNRTLSKPQHGIRAKNKKELLRLLKKIPDLLSERKQEVNKIIEPFNNSQQGILQIRYSQENEAPAPPLYEWLFPHNSKRGNWYKQYNLTNADVAEYLLTLSDKLGILAFLEMVLEKNVSLAIKSQSILSFCSPYTSKMVDEGIGKLESDKVETLVTAIFADMKLEENVWLVVNYLKTYVKEIESFSLEFNINNKVGSQTKALYKPVEVLSLGQKVVAMLSFVLGYSEYSNDYRPLLIDQPEDNLDNQYIYKNLVKQLREIKEQRQVIIATHNSTIVTNAKADQICLMCSDNEHGWLATTGYPGEQRIKKHIVNYLEGGEESFKHKMAIYNDVLS